MHPAIGRLKDRWLSDETAVSVIRSGASVERLETFERKYGVILPPLLRELYELTEGMDGMVDETMLCLTPLDEVVPVCDFDSGCTSLPDEIRGWPDAPPWTKDWFVFADYLINSHLFLVRLTGRSASIGRVVSWDGGDLRHPIAPNFAAFLELWSDEDENRLLHDHTELMPEDWDEEGTPGNSVT